MAEPHWFSGGNKFPFAVGEVVGYRAWRPSVTGLRSLHVPAEWKLKGENVAVCLNSPLMGKCSCDSCRDNPPEPTHPAPDVDCTCGFYAYNTDEDLRVHIKNERNYMTTPLIAGTVKCYGRTMIGTKGLRCEKAEVTGLYQTPSLMWVPRALIKGVPRLDPPDWIAETLGTYVWNPPIGFKDMG